MTDPMKAMQKWTIARPPQDELDALPDETVWRVCEYISDEFDFLGTSEECRKCPHHEGEYEGKPTTRGCRLHAEWVVWAAGRDDH